MAKNLRVGIGYDSHRLSKGRPFMLGGVKIPHTRGLLGHSDADVILHALVDALLGAAGLPDIGTFFSNQDPRWKNKPSLFFLEQAAQILSRKKAQIMNVDCILLSEIPKIAPYVSEMKSNMSKAMHIKSSCIGIKASTNEGMGFVGRREGMAATAVALIKI